MAYSNKYLKGSIGITGNWPLIVLERAKSDNLNTPVLCEVFGIEHESGSCYLMDVGLVTSRMIADSWIEALGDRRPYFKGPLFYTDASGTKHNIQL
jgi:hypothetical protein